MDELTSGLRRFLRGMARAPGFSAAVIGILALGIAASVVVYSAVDALVLDPFPFPEPERLVLVGSEMPAAGRDLSFFERLSGPEIAALIESSRTLSELLAFDLNSVRVRGPEYPMRLFAVFAAADPFPTLAVTPHLGRGFGRDELRRGEPVAVISHSLWQSFFAADPAVLGRPVTVDGEAFEVVGVLPLHASLYGADLFLPLGETLAGLGRERRHFNLLARMAGDADVAAIDAELATIAQRIETEHGGDGTYRGWRLAVTSWSEYNAFAYREAAILSLGAVSFVLLLVCANLANLLLIRATGERRSIAVRRALGASRGRILRLTLLDSACYATAGGLLGLVLAHAGIRLASAWLPAALQPFGKPLAVDGDVLLFAIAAVAVSALAFGAAPALHLLGADLREALGNSRGNLGGRRPRRVQASLVAAQVALAVVLLTGAGTLAAGLAEILDKPPGFDVEQLISMRLTLPGGQYEGEAVPLFFERLVAEVEGLPEVETAAVATQVAPATYFGAELHVRGEAIETDGTRRRSFHTVIGDGYLDAMGLPLLSGRALDARDRAGGSCAMMVNELAAERFFPGDPLGQQARLKASRFDSGWCEVVGVVGTVRNRGLVEEPGPEVFTSHRQAGGRFNQMFLAVRTTGDPAMVVPAVRNAVLRLDAEQPVYAVATGTEAITEAVGTQRATAVLLTAFAAGALLLSAIGIHGVVAFAVAARTREMSVRMALGATVAEIGRLMVRDAMRPVLAGLLLGLVAALGLARTLASMLTATGGVRVEHVAVAALVLLAVAYLASLLPTRRVRRVQPARWLRGQ